MSDALTNFRRREYALRKKHDRMSRGYRNRLSRNGVIVQEPDRKVGGVGVRLLCIAVAGFLVFKVAVLTGLGAETYNSHVAALGAGSSYERVGAWLMQIDPLTAQLTAMVSPLFS